MSSIVSTVITECWSNPMFWHLSIWISTYSIHVRPFHCPVFGCLQYERTEGKAWEISSHKRHHVYVNRQKRTGWEEVFGLSTDSAKYKKKLSLHLYKPQGCMHTTLSFCISLTLSISSIALSIQVILLIKDMGIATFIHELTIDSRVSLYYIWTNHAAIANCTIIIALFPGPRPASRRLQYVRFCKRRKAGRGPGNEATIIMLSAFSCM